MSHITSHVLDAALGRPAAGVPVRLDHRADGGWVVVSTAVTNTDGRAALGPEQLATGIYRVHFDTARYFAATGQTGFYPEVLITFELANALEHYHVPLLLSPFAFSTYRGS